MTILCSKGIVVVSRLIDVLYESLHRLPRLFEDAHVAKLLPHRPRHDNACIGPSHAHHFVAVGSILGNRSHTGIAT